MKIKNAYAVFTTLGNIGRNAFVIELAHDGIETNITSLADSSANFNYVVIKGFEKGDGIEVNQLIKKLLSLSSHMKVEIDSDGLFLPPNAGSYERVLYNIFINPNNTYEKKVIKWCRDASANFIFDLSRIDDIDYIDEFARKYEINKVQIIVNLCSISPDILTIIQLKGYNITLDVKEVLREV